MVVAVLLNDASRKRQQVGDEDAQVVNAPDRLAAHIS
jgi:hypothetical protein